MGYLCIRFNVKDMNYFELFNLPITLTPDKRLLMERYVALQKQYHPDYHTQADEESRERALEISSTINKALKTLQNRDSLLTYVLELNGTITPDEKYNLPADFLMEVMELNETIDDETAASVARLNDEIFSPVADILANYNHEQVSTAALQQLKAYYYKKKYLQRILDRING
jgi:molecular chaperone HscB